MYKLVNTLVVTRINGNSIKGNETYENMLKRVTKHDINRYALDNLDFAIETGLSKLNMIEHIRYEITKG